MSCWQILSAIRAVGTAGEPCEILFCHARFHRFPVDERSRNLNTTSIGVAMKTFGTEFWKFWRKVSFFQKTQKVQKIFNVLHATSGLDNSALITDLRQFTTKMIIHGMSSFHFYRWNQVIPLPVNSVSPYKKPPQILCDRFWISDAWWLKRRVLTYKCAFWVIKLKLTCN